MQKMRMLILIALGMSLIISAFTSGNFIATQNTYAMSQPATSPAVQTLDTQTNCRLCHVTSSRSGERELATQPYMSGNTGLQFQLLSSTPIPHQAVANQKIAIDPEAIYAILTAPHTGQSIRMQDFSGPIVQCGFCHSEMIMKASMPIGEHE